MKFIVLCLFILFIVIGIVKNKVKNYAKQVGVSLMLLGTLNALALYNVDSFSGDDPVQYLDIFFINPKQMDLYGNLSIGVALFGLIIYLFSEIKR
ncbi:hypothetical protein DZB84_16395 [Bacillus sp. HNG]|uniref:hypothetical protein n=1 Tax=Bacillus sp. HNG TaxID=2293325 RepID=UPI000E2EA8BB|nr:hypothetical protein [Bacillus sp. HNG]RFB13550.1 hypothetical protein DZB84_16395 [Bacillus sp. HNG]